MSNQSLVLVTGGTGFLGAHLVRLLLQQKYNIRAIHRKGSSKKLLSDIADQVQWVEADVTDIVAMEDAFQGVTHVCHCAAMVSFHPKDVRRMMQINVEGTANMVNLALDFGVQKFIHVSSIAALGRSKERTHLDESMNWVESKGNSQYAISKYRSEQEVWRAEAEGLPVAIVNPSVIIGPGDWSQGSARFFSQVDQGLKFSPVGCSGMVDVEDVARFMALLLASDIRSERFILNAENILYKDFFAQVAAALGKKAPSITVTPLLAEVAWRVEWLKEKLLGIPPIVTKESARASVSSYTYANEKSRGVFQFEYRPLSETIRRTAAQYLKEHGK
jgi:dihydroflavonol-4-reductase